MFYKELLKSLQELDSKQLEKEVVILDREKMEFLPCGFKIADENNVFEEHYPYLYF